MCKKYFVKNFQRFLAVLISCSMLPGPAFAGPGPSRPPPEEDSPQIVTTRKPSNTPPPARKKTPNGTSARETGRRPPSKGNHGRAATETIVDDALYHLASEQPGATAVEDFGEGDDGDRNYDNPPGASEYLTVAADGDQQAEYQEIDLGEASALPGQAVYADTQQRVGRNHSSTTHCWDPTRYAVTSEENANGHEWDLSMYSVGPERGSDPLYLIPVGGEGQVGYMTHNPLFQGLAAPEQYYTALDVLAPNRQDLVTLEHHRLRWANFGRALPRVYYLLLAGTSANCPAFPPSDEKTIRNSHRLIGFLEGTADAAMILAYIATLGLGVHQIIVGSPYDRFLKIFIGGDIRTLYQIRNFPGQQALGAIFALPFLNGLRESSSRAQLADFNEALQNDLKSQGASTWGNDLWKPLLGVSSSSKNIQGLTQKLLCDGRLSQHDALEILGQVYTFSKGHKSILWARAAEMFYAIANGVSSATKTTPDKLTLRAKALFYLDQMAKDASDDRFKKLVIRYYRWKLGLSKSKKESALWGSLKGAELIFKTLLLQGTARAVISLMRPYDDASTAPSPASTQSSTPSDPLPTPLPASQNVTLAQQCLQGVIRAWNQFPPEDPEETVLPRIGRLDALRNQDIDISLGGKSLTLDQIVAFFTGLREVQPDARVRAVNLGGLVIRNNLELQTLLAAIPSSTRILDLTQPTRQPSPPGGFNFTDLRKFENLTSLELFGWNMEGNFTSLIETFPYLPLEYIGLKVTGLGRTPDTGLFLKTLFNSSTAKTIVIGSNSVGLNPLDTRSLAEAINGTRAPIEEFNANSNYIGYQDGPNALLFLRSLGRLSSATLLDIGVNPMGQQAPPTGESYARTLAESLRNLSELQLLNLEGTFLPEASVADLMDLGIAITQRNLTYLLAARPANGAPALPEPVLNLLRTRFANLTETATDINGIFLVSDVATQLPPTITNLALHSKIGQTPDVLQELGERLETLPGRVTRVDFSVNANLHPPSYNPPTEFSSRLAPTIRRFSNITHLSLFHNGISGPDGTAWLQALNQSNCEALEHLNLGSNGFTNLIPLGPVLNRTIALAELLLGGVPLSQGPTSLQVLGSTFHNLRNLTTLGLSGCGISGAPGRSDLEAFFERVSLLRELQNLDINSNAIEDGTLVANAIRRLPDLQAFTIGNNPIRTGADDLAAAVLSGLQNGTLRTFSLAGNISRAFLEAHRDQIRSVTDAAVLEACGSELFDIITNTSSTGGRNRRGLEGLQGGPPPAQPSFFEGDFPPVTNGASHLQPPLPLRLIASCVSSMWEIISRLYSQPPTMSPLQSAEQTSWQGTPYPSFGNLTKSEEGLPAEFSKPTVVAPSNPTETIHTNHTSFSHSSRYEQTQPADTLFTEDTETSSSSFKSGHPGEPTFAKAIVRQLDSGSTTVVFLIAMIRFWSLPDPDQMRNRYETYLPPNPDVQAKLAQRLEALEPQLWPLKYSSLDRYARTQTDHLEFLHDDFSRIFSNKNGVPQGQLKSFEKDLRSFEEFLRKTNYYTLWETNDSLQLQERALIYRYRLVRLSETLTTLGIDQYKEHIRKMRQDLKVAENTSNPKKKEALLIKIRDDISDFSQLLGKDHTVDLWERNDSLEPQERALIYRDRLARLSKALLTIPNIDKESFWVYQKHIRKMRQDLEVTENTSDSTEQHELLGEIQDNISSFAQFLRKDYKIALWKTTDPTPKFLEPHKRALIYRHRLARLSKALSTLKIDRSSLRPHQRDIEDMEQKLEVAENTSDSTEQHKLLGKIRDDISCFARSLRKDHNVNVSLSVDLETLYKGPDQEREVEKLRAHATAIRDGQRKGAEKVNARQERKALRREQVNPRKPNAIARLRAQEAAASAKKEAAVAKKQVRNAKKEAVIARAKATALKHQKEKEKERQQRKDLRREQVKPLKESAIARLREQEAAANAKKEAAIAKKQAALAHSMKVDAFLKEFLPRPFPTPELFKREAYLKRKLKTPETLEALIRVLRSTPQRHSPASRVPPTFRRTAMI